MKENPWLLLLTASKPVQYLTMALALCLVIWFVKRQFFRDDKESKLFKMAS